MSLKLSKIREIWPILWRGYLMGACDLIPGVSGGTIALMTGIYPRLMNVLSSFDGVYLKDAFCLLKQKDWKGFYQRTHLSFLLPLLLSIVCAVMSLSHVMHYFLKEHHIVTFSVLSTFIFLTWCTLFREFSLHRFKTPLGVLIGLCFLFFLSWGASWLILGLENLLRGTPWEKLQLSLYLLSGWIAIQAMLLPGISGSLLLLAIGHYEIITQALMSITYFKNIQDSFLILFFFSVGAILGLVTGSKLIKKTLQKYPLMTNGFLLGLVLGSLIKIWPWRLVQDFVVIKGQQKVISYQYYFPTFDQPKDQIIESLLFSAIALLIFFGLEAIKLKYAKQK
jgi:putative membrane protein